MTRAEVLHKVDRIAEAAISASIADLHQRGASRGTIAAELDRVTRAYADMRRQVEQQIDEWVREARHG